MFITDNQNLDPSPSSNAGTCRWTARLAHHPRGYDHERYSREAARLERSVQQQRGPAEEASRRAGRQPKDRHGRRTQM